MHTRIRLGPGRFRRPALALALSLVSLAGSSLVPARASAAAGPKFLGPLLSRAENSSVSWGRDGGYSVPLPNGTDFWVFADTPRYQYQQGKWNLTAFLAGSTAAVGKFTPGHPPTEPLTEVHPGGKLAASNKPAVFMSNPYTLYMHDGSGRTCSKANGGPKTNPVRWATGAALMPDKTNIVIPYIMVCVINERIFTAEGWGFTEFNWKTNKFSIKAVDVFPPRSNGAPIPTTYYFGSPIIVNNKVTFYSWACCELGSGVYITTVDATLAALKNSASYIPTLIPNSPGTFDLHVAPKSKTHSSLTMYALTGMKGDYAIYSAPAPSGPWSPVASGALPRCDTSPKPCHSIILHPELSAPSRLLFTYHVPGFGPGVASKHPYPKDPLRHVVMASVPCNC